MIRIKKSSVDEWLERCSCMFEVHYMEAGRDLPFLPNYEHFRRADEAGRLLVLIAEKDDRAVGYSVNYIGPHPHYSSSIICRNDSLYLDPDCRGGTIGVRLIQATERAAQEVGAVCFLCGARPDSVLADILPRMNYELSEVIYCRRFDNG